MTTEEKIKEIETKIYFHYGVMRSEWNKECGLNAKDFMRIAKNNQKEHGIPLELQLEVVMGDAFDNKSHSANLIFMELLGGSKRPIRLTCDTDVYKYHEKCFTELAKEHQRLTDK